jgi:hypothetical protein
MPTVDSDSIDYFDINQQKLKELCIRDGINIDNIVTRQPKTLEATIIEYYQAITLLADCIYRKDNVLTNRLLRIFNVIKLHNLKFFGENWKETDNDKLRALPLLSIAWADQLKIVELLNADGGCKIENNTTLYNDIKIIQKKGLIGSSHFPGSKNHLGYYITTIEADNSVTLPKPSLINDTVYKGKSLKVVNFTNEDVIDLQGFKDSPHILLRGISLPGKCPFLFHK